uniref:Uncharacterized protein n=1 Tax=Cacopsylla melanoneura TaxID=428564 RepID=A0A8D8TLN0_9HEMI
MQYAMVGNIFACYHLFFCKQLFELLNDKKYDFFNLKVLMINHARYDMWVALKNDFYFTYPIFFFVVCIYFNAPLSETCVCGTWVMWLYVGNVGIRGLLVIKCYCCTFRIFREHVRNHKIQE